MKRRSSGGPEIFAAAQRKISSSNSTSRIGENWKAQILIEHPDGPETSSSTTGTTAYWQGPRRGSLPVDVYIASSAGSCSSESESSGETTLKDRIFSSILSGWHYRISVVAKKCLTICDFSSTGDASDT